MNAPGGSSECLGALWGSFQLSWGALWPHVASLGTPFGFIFALLGRLGASFWPKLGQVVPRWPKMVKKNSIFAITFRKLDQVGARKSRKIDVKSDVFFKCVSDIDFYQFLIDFGLRKSTFFWSVFQLKAKTWIL